MELCSDLIDVVYRRCFYPKLIEGEARDDREKVHENAIKLLGENIEACSLVRDVTGKLLTYRSRRLEQAVFGLKFNNPLGVAPGFDKNGLLPNTIPALGFGYTEIGTVTPKPQPGQTPPRIFVLEEDQALINRMGFPSEGMDVVYHNLTRYPADKGRILGINVGPNATSVQAGTRSALDDIGKGISCFANIADYLVVNISSPNTSNLRDLQGKKTMELLVDKIDEVFETESDFDAKHRLNRKFAPILLKISPDLNTTEIDVILKAISGRRISGIVVSNTTINADRRAGLSGPYRDELGGISGKPLKELALAASKHIYQQTKGNLTIIRAGGISNSEDAYEAITVGGASLLQVYSALVLPETSRPTFAYRVLKGLDKRLKDAGYENIADAVGKAA